MVDAAFFLFVFRLFVLCCQMVLYCIVCNKCDFNVGILKYLCDNSGLFTNVCKFSPFCSFYILFLFLLVVYVFRIEASYLLLVKICCIDIYRKPTTTDFIIRNGSCHPREHKMAAIYYFYNRMNIYKLLYDKIQKEINTIQQILPNNKYNASILKT